MIAWLPHWVHWGRFKHQIFSTKSQEDSMRLLLQRARTSLPPWSLDVFQMCDRDLDRLNRAISEMKSDVIMDNEWKRIQPETKFEDIKAGFFKGHWPVILPKRAYLNHLSQVAGMERPWRMAASVLCSICSHPSTSISVLKWLVHHDWYSFQLF